MIPYDDLVGALASWRARQGLSVAESAVPVQAAPSPSDGTRPPSAPTKAVPPPLAPVDTRDEEVDEAALLEEAHYENEGDDFAMAFGGGQPAEQDFESTSIGSPPPPGAPRDSFGGSTEPEPGSGKHNRNDDW